MELNISNIPGLTAIAAVEWELELTVGRIGAYKRMAGESNCPYTRADFTALACAEIIEAEGLRRALKALIKEIG